MPHLNLRHLAGIAVVLLAFAAHASDDVQPVSNDALNRAQAQRKHKHRSVREVIGTVDPDIDAHGDVGGDHANLGLGYNYSVDPSYQSGLYTRTDRWHPSGTLAVPGLRGSISGEVTVVRQFSSKKQALLARPSSRLRAMPFTAENALSLEAGSIMSIPVRTEAFEGVEGSMSVAGPVSLGGRVGHVDRGSYQVQVQRLSGSRVRIRLVATRQHAWTAEGGLHLGLFPVSSSLLSTSHTRGKRNTVAAEYVFDLGNADARVAYNDMFKRGRLRPSASLAQPFGHTDRLQERIGDGLAGVDEIALADSSREPSARRISQSFKSIETGTPDEHFHGAKLAGFLRLNRSSAYTPDSRLSYEDDAGVVRTTMASTSESVRGTRLLFGLRNETETRRATMVTKTSESGVPTGTGEYIVTLELKDKRMGRSETSRAREKLARLMAPSIMQKLAIDPVLTSTSYKNARIYSQVIFSEDAFAKLAGLSASSLESSLTSYLRSVGSPYDDHRSSITKVATLLAEALSPDVDPTRRTDLFASLQRESLFRDDGSGFLMSLLPVGELETLVSVYIRIDATAFAQSIRAHFGKSDFHNLENAIECSAYQNNRGSIDLRLEDVCAGVSGSATTTPLPAHAAPAAAAAPAAH